MKPNLNVELRLSTRLRIFLTQSFGELNESLYDSQAQDAVEC